MNYSLSKGGKFKSAASLASPIDDYRILPFKFDKFDDQHSIVTNEVGEYTIIDSGIIEKLTKGDSIPAGAFSKLERIHVVSRESSAAAYKLLPLKIRRKYKELAEFTSLHMMVVTLRCNQACPYCQVSRQSEDRDKYDMSLEDALKALELIYQSPSRYIKIEFQGGESLLNFQLIKDIVIEVETNGPKNKHFEFVAATNLTFLTDEILDFFGSHNISFSTSIDGPQDLHDKNRPYKGKQAFEVVCSNIKRIQSCLGTDKVSALMTTTKRSLGRVKEIIDEYVGLGFNGVFLRSLSPYGHAMKTKTYYEYSALEWLDFYYEGLDYVLELNKQGVFFEEFYTKILAQKILGNRPIGYVDLQSPTGAGTMAAIYDYNGNIYASDEGRMLAQMGDESLQLGSVNMAYDEVFVGDKMNSLVQPTILESVPMCSDCAFMPWCGSDPSYHQSTQKDFVGHKAFSGFCHKQMGAFKHLINIFDKRPADRKIIESWI